MQIERFITTITCDHCGEECGTTIIRYDEHNFCCEGCKSVYEILQQNQLCDYYDLDNKPGISPKPFYKEKWAYLDNEEIQKQVLRFQSSNLDIVELHIPGMHCASCIYLLENLHKVLWGVISADVNFVKRDIIIKYDPREVSLRKVVETLCAIGYAPVINMQLAEEKKKKKTNRSLYYKIGVAGFCFGNIMILSLPEYFDSRNLLTPSLTYLFRYLNLALVLPVLVFSASDYWKAAWQAIRMKRSSMDLTIALGIAGLTIQSFYDILSGHGGGYFDSTAGLIFFLLIGKFVQQRSFDALSFDRDYKSYFPLAITRIRDIKEENVNVNELQPEDRILVHNEELIPADSLLESTTAYIDYSFVTGESEPVLCKTGDLIYAGGRNKGTKARLKVVQPVSQSYLTRLWNAEAFKKEKDNSISRWADQISYYFTAAVIIIALGTGIYWRMHDTSIMMRAVTSVLIVACPCVLALSIPYTFGNILRIFGKRGFYLKDALSLERLASIDTIVFDKTGTLTYPAKTEVSWNKAEVNVHEKQLLYSVASQSTHPISRGLKMHPDTSDIIIQNWKETVGEGLKATIEGEEISIGKKAFVTGNATDEEGTFFGMNGLIKGQFRIIHRLRNNIRQLAEKLNNSFHVFVLSGDSDRQKAELSAYFNPNTLFFRQSPDSKREFIRHQQIHGHKVMMIGDGLNDAAALKASDFGITITDDINSFTPAADAILDANSLSLLPDFVKLAKETKRVVYGAFVFSAAYNCIGLSFALRGQLLPWVAAILMPVSSITVVLYTHFATRWLGKKLHL
jgi:Cu+-exporting ATPase